jgi:hypothetical protein
LVDGRRAHQRESFPGPTPAASTLSPALDSAEGIEDDPAVPVRPLSDVRAIVATAVGLLLVALVALASGGSPWHAGGRQDTPAGVTSALATAAFGLVAALGAAAALYGENVPAWSIPLLAAGVLTCFELVSLSRGPAPDAAVERPAVVSVLVGRLLVVALLALGGASVALLAAAVPARHGFATGLVGAGAAAALFLLLAAVARRGGPVESR